MKSISLNSYKVQAYNPVKDILEIIPYTESVLDVALLDSIKITLSKALKTHLITNSYTLILLSYLSDEGLVELSKVNPVSSLGTIHFIKRL